MIRVGIFGDCHFDLQSRWDECVAIHTWMADDMAARGARLAVCTGDVYERKSLPAERRAVAALFQRITDAMPLVVVRGNHDAPQDLAIFAKLETKHPLIVEEQAAVHVVAGVAVACLSWPSKASVLAMSEATSHAEGELVAGEALRNVLRGLGLQLASAANSGNYDGVKVLPTLLAAHAMVRGSTTSVGQPLVGCDLEVGVEDLALCGADFVALGHVHKGQEWEHGGTPYVYSGSPRRTTFGEVEDKGYLLVDFDETTGELVSWQRVRTPCAPMLLLEDEWGQVFDDSELRGWCVGDKPEDEALVGAEVRFRYRVPGDMRDEAAAAADRVAADLMARGAVVVKLDPVVIPSNGARAPDVAKARTVEEKLCAFWRARGTEPDEERRARLLSKVDQLRGELP